MAVRPGWLRAHRQRQPPVTAPLLFKEGWREAPGWLQSSRKLLGDVCEDAVRIVEYFPVLDADDPEAELFQEFRSVAVVIDATFAVMRRSVELDYESFLGTVEVHDIRTDTVLPSEFSSL